jgi:hypothetical protein
MEIGAEDGDPEDTGKPDKAAWRTATGASSDSDSD